MIKKIFAIMMVVMISFSFVGRGLNVYAEDIESTVLSVVEESKTEEVAETVEEKKPTEEVTEAVEEKKPTEEVAEAVEEKKPTEEVTEIVEEKKPTEEVAEAVEEKKPTEEVAETVEDDRIVIRDSRDLSDTNVIDNIFIRRKNQSNFENSLDIKSGCEIEFRVEFSEKSDNNINARDFIILDLPNTDNDDFKISSFNDTLEIFKPIKAGDENSGKKMGDVFIADGQAKIVFNEFAGSLDDVNGYFNYYARLSLKSTAAEGKTEYKYSFGVLKEPIIISVDVPKYENNNEGPKTFGMYKVGHQEMDGSIGWNIVVNRDMVTIDTTSISNVIISDELLGGLKYDKSSFEIWFSNGSKGKTLKINELNEIVDAYEVENKYGIFSIDEMKNNFTMSLDSSCVSNYTLSIRYKTVVVDDTMVEYKNKAVVILNSENIVYNSKVQYFRASAGADGDKDNSIPWTPLEPSTPVEEETIPWTPLEPSTPVEEETIPWTPLEPSTPIEEETIPWTPLEPSTPVEEETIPWTRLEPSTPVEEDVIKNEVNDPTDDLNDDVIEDDNSDTDGDNSISLIDIEPSIPIVTEEEIADDIVPLGDIPEDEIVDDTEEFENFELPAGKLPDTAGLPSVYIFISGLFFVFLGLLIKRS